PRRSHTYRNFENRCVPRRSPAWGGARLHRERNLTRLAREENEVRWPLVRLTDCGHGRDWVAPQPPHRSVRAELPYVGQGSILLATVTIQDDDLLPKVYLADGDWSVSEAASASASGSAGQPTTPPVSGSLPSLAAPPRARTLKLCPPWCSSIRER